MIIGVQQGLSGQFIAPMGDDLVHVHVALGTAARLPDCQRKISVQFALQDLIADLPDDLAPFLVQFVQSLVGLGSALLR